MKEQTQGKHENARALIAMMILLSLLFCFFGSGRAAEDDAYEHVMVLEDPAYFVFTDEGSESEPNAAGNFPVITSAGKRNVKINGVQSKGKLIAYTIPEELLRADSDFLALMVEAEKYIGYPYVYGASNPDTGFDCSGFVCWVFMHSGVYDTGRLGANGLYTLCTEVSEADVRPGDLVFFKGTMGVAKGITHVGMYVGNHMMIHAGDPVGFADLCSSKWASKIVCYGRLPID